MLISTGNCCCLASSYKVYTAENTLVLGSPTDSKIWELDAETGALGAHIFSDTQGIQSIACSPLTGNLYVACSENQNVKAITSNGTALWTAAFGSVVRGVAVTNDGYVYAVGASGNIKKYNALTGAEITSGWPYAFVTDLYSVCVDQSGNVYATGVEQTTGSFHNCVALTSAGAVIWKIRLKGPTLGARDTTYCGGIAIDGSGISLVVSRQSGTAVETIFVVNASTGTFSGTVAGASRFCAATGPLTNRYSGGDADAGAFNMEKDEANYYKAPLGRRVKSIAIGNDGAEFVVAGNQVISVLGGWVHTGAGNNTQVIETSQGRVGAFGA